MKKLILVLIFIIAIVGGLLGLFEAKHADEREKVTSAQIEKLMHRVDILDEFVTLTFPGQVRAYLKTK